ncbi:MAG: branched-chain amino acid ABC transporter substrate-binding protein [Solirubrobacteraceae bacterium MAG38_C4-C5]|nr:branched-chain amino acid ABC transporter substrate-binding protein [Candidatus Siliceabacter maunaloa]
MRGALRPAALVAACCLLFAACGGDGPRAAGEDDQIEGTRTLTVYTSMPLHGPAAATGRDAVNAVKLALEEARGRAGLFGVNFVALDAATPETETEGWDRDRVLDNARRVISDSGAIAYIGELSSGASALSVPVLNQGGVLMVSPSSTYVGLTREGGIGRGEPERFYPSGQRTFARVVPADHVQAAAQVRLMAEEDVERVYVLHDAGLYGRGLAEQVETVARREGIEVLSVEQASDDPADARGIARDVAQAAPDGVLYAGDVGSNALGILDAVNEASPETSLFAPDALATTRFLDGVDVGLERRLHVTSPTIDRRRLPSAARDFHERFRATFGKAPEPYAVYAYESMKAVLAAIEQVGPRGNDRSAVTEQFLGLERRGTALGDYAIDRYGDTSLRRYGAYRVSDGRLVFDELLEVPT